MHQPVLSFESVTFTYPDSPEPAVREVSFSIGPGWTVLAGANGSGKTTILKLAAGLLLPERGLVSAKGETLYCQQRTDEPPEGFDEFVGEWMYPGIMAELGIEWDWPTRWSSLSYGERKRAQLAQALCASPAILAVDEPVNHLDREARRVVKDALSGYKGIGILVSHDRELMDSLASRCGIIHPEGLKIRQGGYTVARREDEREQKALRSAKGMARKKFFQMKRDARRKQLVARTLQARSSGRKITYKEICIQGSEGPSRVDSSVQKAGQLSRTAQGRMNRAREELEAITFRKSYRTGVTMSGEVCRRNRLVSIPAGVFEVGGNWVTHPDLTINHTDRIALIGPNGAGKSTLVRSLIAVMNLPGNRLLYIPQELTAHQSSHALAGAKELGKEVLGRVMTCIRRLGSHPEALLESTSPSPGETRKLMLCLGLLGNPWIVVMDEPTNHLDLPGIECLEGALRDIQCALLLVSHDKTFLKNTTSIQWTIEVSHDGRKLRIE